MLIPDKFSGYRAGIRLYPGGGGGGGGGDGGDAGGGAAGDAGGGGGDGGFLTNVARKVTTPTTTTTSAPGPVQSNLPAPVQVVDNRPVPGSGQFYQPIYRPMYTQYRDDNMGSLLSVASYGRPTGQSYFMQNPDVQQAYGQNNYGMSPDQFAQTHFQNYGQYEQRMAPAPMYNPYQMSTPFNPYMNGFQTPFSMPMQRMSSGPSQAIVSRSAGVRGAPVAMARRASGGIADLVGE